MHIISRRALKEHWEQRGRGDSEQPLRAWLAEAKQAQWESPADIKAMYGNASFVGDNRVVFNIGGPKYRLVVHMNYASKVAYVKFVGSHEEYDEIDVETVGGTG